jgi:two-component system phosphate regulon sensor histidine kinase PhoR
MDDLLPPNSTPVIATVLEGIVEPVLVIADGRVEEANAAARELLGHHILGQDVRLAIRHPAAAERLTAPPGAGVSGPINLVGLGTLDQRWELRVTDIPDGRRVVHLIDQTGSYAAERMRVDFVANASHELRTPLASILGFAETLSEDDGADPAMRQRFLKVMVDEARRMQRLVEDLISLSRIEAEKYRLPDAAVDLAALLEEVTSELIDTGDSRATDIAIELADDVPAVPGDRVQLSQALHNLIGNAMKYGRPGTPVAIKLWRYSNSMARLSVGDEGDGIAPEHIPRLTERFYRVDSGRSRAVGGTGLGLAIVKHVVERHRGRLDIASQVGRGTVVTILLPAEPGAVIKG